MLHKLLCAQKLQSLLHGHDPPAPAPAGLEAGLSALKIIHAGGIVERHYMAVPATRIMQKNPSCMLARPDVFRKPRNALVRPEEILLPGQKFFLVPRRTVKKLWQRQPVTGDLTEMVSQTKTPLPSNETNVSFSSTNTALKTRGQNGPSTKHVRFFGIDAKKTGTLQPSLSAIREIHGSD